MPVAETGAKTGGPARIQTGSIRDRAAKVNRAAPARMPQSELAGLIDPCSHEPARKPAEQITAAKKMRWHDNRRNAGSTPAIVAPGPQRCELLACLVN